MDRISRLRITVSKCYPAGSELLAIRKPTDRKVRAWNGWNAKQHKAVEEQLIGRGLIVRDKTRRAGRTAFLPGDWYRKVGWESWKNKTGRLHPVRGGGYAEIGIRSPRADLPTVFAEQWQRILGGDVPK
ncbi:hypothetical protein ACFXHA_01980 [Nocardia sp. NPDC059240]|uniref:hypothetical protein n=1 Tax=Nocardia sp. NPDC059240 TaxID=3346786 RepID=UPI0036A392A5